MEFEKETFIKKYYDDFKRKFTEVTIEKGFWDTYYSKEGMIEIFEQASAVKDFNRVDDADIINAIEANCMTAKGIRTTQNRLLIYAKK